MRTENALKNTIMNFASNVLSYGLRFIARIVFVKTLAEVYLGVNGLLSNVLGILALTELGIGSAIGFSLYEPLANNDKEKIKYLMNYYKKAYRIISLIILISGLIFLLFLPYLIKDPLGIENLKTIYLIYLLNMVIGYLFSYKRTLISSDQKKYKIMPIIMGSSIVTSIAQIIVLVLFKNYIIYLIIQSICTVLENVLVNKYINKKYQYIKEKDIKEFSKKELKKIQKNVKSLMLHKVGSYVLTSTDNLVISKYIGIILVGFYSNYCLIINMINTIIATFQNNALASIGNLMVKETEEKKYRIFKELDLLYFYMYGIGSICFIMLFTPFITLFFGKNYLLSTSVVYVIVFNFYINGINGVPISFNSAAGLYSNDKFAPLIQSVINLVISVVLVIKIGLVGVFIGTAISNLIPFIVKPLITYRHILKRKVIEYFWDFIKHITLLGGILILVILVSNILTINNLIIQIAIKLILSVLIPTILIIIFYRNTEAYKDTKNRIANVLDNIIKKQKKHITKG